MSTDKQDIVVLGTLSIVLLAGFGLRMLWRVLAARRRCVGTVVATAADGWGNDTAPVVEFQADGQTVRFTSVLSGPFELGAPVPVRYSPRDPASAWVDTFAATWLWIALYLGLAGICVVILLLM